MRRKLKKEFHRSTGCSQFFRWRKRNSAWRKNVFVGPLMTYFLSRWFFTWDIITRHLAGWQTYTHTAAYYFCDDDDCCFARLNATAIFLPRWWKHIAHFDSWLRTWPLLGANNGFDSTRDKCLIYVQHVASWTWDRSLMISDADKTWHTKQVKDIYHRSVVWVVAICKLNPPLPGPSPVARWTSWGGQTGKWHKSRVTWTFWHLLLAFWAPTVFQSRKKSWCLSVDGCFVIVGLPVWWNPFYMLSPRHTGSNIGALWLVASFYW